MSAEAIARTRIDTKFLKTSLARIRYAKNDTQAELELRDLIRKVQCEATFTRVFDAVQKSKASAAELRRSA